MKKVDIIIKQAPVSVNFTCPCCEEEFEIDYGEFADDMVIADLGSLLNDRNDFICPSCNETLEIDEATLD